jgi:hypothetical protein
MIPLRQSGAVRWLVLVLAATASVALLGAGLTWSAAPVARSPHALHGSIVDFTPDGTQPGLMVAMEPAADCANCHRSQQAGDGEFMPHDTWSGSMMAHATRDPLFWAALDVANADAEAEGFPGVGDFCLRCHTPTGWLEGRVRKTFGGGIIEGQNGCQIFGDHDNGDGIENDYGGLTCHFCHRMMETGPAGETAPKGNGNYWVDDSFSCETPDGGSWSGPCRAGPYKYDANSPVAPPTHGWRYSEFHDHGAICGVCHDVSTPITDQGPFKTLILPDGSDSKIPMPVERTFTEWQRSDFADVIFRDRLGDDFDFSPQLAKGATCQDCHMASSEDPVARACTFTDEGSRAGNLPVHEFVGANTWVPAIIRGEYVDNENSGLTERGVDIDRTIVRARHMLTERSAEIETEVTSSGANQLTATVKVINKAGHKLPTGYAEGRRMWLHVVARDANDTVVWENGAWDPATGALSIDAQTKVYETLQGIWNESTQTCEIEDDQGRKQFHFVLNNCIVKDNRIPPLGFSGGSDLETRPVGYTYPSVPGGSKLVNHDLTTYTIPLPAGVAGPVTVTATLKFQIASDDYIKFLDNQATERGFEAENLMCSTGPGRPFDVGPQDKTRGRFMFDLWNDPAYGRSPPEDMVSASATIAP